MTTRTELEAISARIQRDGQAVGTFWYSSDILDSRHLKPDVHLVIKIGVHDDLQPQCCVVGAFYLHRTGQIIIGAPQEVYDWFTDLYIGEDGTALALAELASKWFESVRPKPTVHLPVTEKVTRWSDCTVTDDLTSQLREKARTL